MQKNLQRMLPFPSALVLWLFSCPEGWIACLSRQWSQSSTFFCYQVARNAAPDGVKFVAFGNGNWTWLGHFYEPGHLEISPMLSITNDRPSLIQVKPFTFNLMDRCPTDESSIKGWCIIIAGALS